MFGVKIKKMDQGYYGVNYLVKDLVIGKVEIVFMNYGFMVDVVMFLDGVEESYCFLFDGINLGLKVVGKLIIFVQYYLEVSFGL